MIDKLILSFSLLPLSLLSLSHVGFVDYAGDEAVVI